LINPRLVSGDSNIKAGEEAAIEHFSKTAIFVSRIFSIKFVCKQVSKINARFNKTKEVKLFKLIDNSATFELRYRPNIQLNKDICNWNLGVYTGIPKMTGAIGAAEYVEKPIDQRYFALIVRKVL
jgi:hypothetical protein